MSNGRRRPRLVGAGALLVLCAVAMTTLYLLFPGQERFALQSERYKPDSVSIAYLQAMLRSAPGDNALRLELVRQLLETGQWREAANVLGGLHTDSENLLTRADLQRLRIRAEQITELPADRNPTLRRRWNGCIVWRWMLTAPIWRHASPYGWPSCSPRGRSTGGAKPGAGIWLPGSNWRLPRPICMRANTVAAAWPPCGRCMPQDRSGAGAPRVRWNSPAKPGTDIRTTARCRRRRSHLRAA
ncbi:MAG: tetratricopeptide repeat protein [Acidihalobacter sp.]